MTLSPRQEALNSILQVRAEYSGASIETDVWDQLVNIAWDGRTQSGDRREIQRSIRQVLLEAARQQGDADDATA
jgi:hypothetical protein